MKCEDTPAPSANSEQHDELTAMMRAVLQAAQDTQQRTQRMESELVAQSKVLKSLTDRVATLEQQPSSLAFASSRNGSGSNLGNASGSVPFAGRSGVVDVSVVGGKAWGTTLEGYDVSSRSHSHSISTNDSNSGVQVVRSDTISPKARTANVRFEEPRTSVTATGNMNVAMNNGRRRLVSFATDFVEDTHRASPVHGRQPSTGSTGSGMNRIRHSIALSSASSVEANPLLRDFGEMSLLSDELNDDSDTTNDSDQNGEGAKASRPQSSPRSKKRRPPPPRVGTMVGGKVAGGGRLMGASVRTAAESQPEEPSSFIDEPKSPSQTVARTHSDSDTQGTIHPDHPVVVVFDILYLVAAVVTILMLITVYHPLSGIDVEAFPQTWFLSWELVLSAYSAAFVALRMRVRCRRSMDSWILEDRPAFIRKVYFRSWFALDVVMAIPFELIFLGWLNAGFHYVAAKHFLRYVRVLALTPSPLPLAIDRKWFRFMVFCASMIIVAHVAASGFWSAMDSVPEGKGLSYSDSLYWALATMTSVGYGDIVPITEGQRIYAIFCMMCGILMISAFTALATQYLTSKDAITEETDKQKMMMSALLHHYRVPWGLSKEVIAVFPSVLNNGLSSHFRSSIEALPPFLRDQLGPYFNASQLRSIPMLHNVPESLLLELATATHTMFVAAFDYVFLEKEPSVAMYVLLRGVIEVTKSDGHGGEVVLATLRDGECFGEMGLLKDQPRMANAVAVVASELLVLSKAVFERLVEGSEEFCDTVLKFIMSRDQAAAGAGRDNSLGDSQKSDSKSGEKLGESASSADQNTSGEVDAVLRQLTETAGPSQEKNPLVQPEEDEVQELSTNAADQAM